MRTQKRLQKGAVLPLVVLGLLVIIMGVALAFSAGVSYMVKAKLNAATDSAGLAAANAISQGSTQAEQIVYAKAAAVNFFNANFPSGYMGATAKLGDVLVSFDDNAVTVTVSASASLPAALLGTTLSGPLTPAVTTQTTRKNLDMVLTLDTSGSLSGSAATVRSSAITFLNQFNITRDRIGLVQFAYGSVIVDGIKTTVGARGFDRASMTTHINDTKNFKFEGSTASVEGMWRARAQLDSVPTTNLNRSNLRVIVFFSDGAPNSLGADLVWTNKECPNAGTINTDDDGSGTPRGLYKLDATNTAYSNQCNPYEYYNEDKNGNHTELSAKAKLPAYYNAHDSASTEFAIVTTSPRVVTSTINYQNVNRAARNLAEAMAAKAQDDGVYVFTLGLGSQLKAATGYDGEKGEDTLKCMANSLDAPSRCYRSTKPVGVYCYAATQSDLTPCFGKLASAIMRITK